MSNFLEVGFELRETNAVSLAIEFESHRAREMRGATAGNASNSERRSRERGEWTDTLYKFAALVQPDAMVDTRMILELIPHYFAMLFIIVIGVATLRMYLGDVSLPAEFGLALVIVVLYPFTVRHLGIEPGIWE